MKSVGIATELKQHVTNAYRRNGGKAPQIFLILALDGAQWPASHSRWNSHIKGDHFRCLICFFNNKKKKKMHYMDPSSPWRKRATCSADSRMSGPQSEWRHAGKEKKPLPGIIPQHETVTRLSTDWAILACIYSVLHKNTSRKWSSITGTIP